MIERLGELNDKFFQLYGELHYNEELLTNEQSNFMAKCLFEQYIAEYERLQLSSGIEENKEYMRLKMLNGAYTPRKSFFRKNRALKQLLNEVNVEVENYFKECDRRLQEYLNAREEEESCEEEQAEEEQEDLKEGREESGEKEQPEEQTESCGEVGEKEPDGKQEEQRKQEQPAATVTIGEKDQSAEQAGNHVELINEIVIESGKDEVDGQEQADGKKAVKKRANKKKKQSDGEINGQISFIS